eukprot:3805131-Amphidinium_carterae.1
MKGDHHPRKVQKLQKMFLSGLSLRDWRSIKKIPKELQLADNANIPLQAVSQSGAALGYLCSELRANRFVVMRAVSCN